jgi:hypothetical protein
MDRLALEPVEPGRVAEREVGADIAGIDGQRGLECVGGVLRVALGDRRAAFGEQRPRARILAGIRRLLDDAQR